MRKKFILGLCLTILTTSIVACSNSDEENKSSEVFTTTESELTLEVPTTSEITSTGESTEKPSSPIEFESSSTIENTTTDVPVPVQEEITFTENLEISVWVSEKGFRLYHIDSECGLMEKESVLVPIQEAEQKGFTPCTRCHN